MRRFTKTWTQLSLWSLLTVAGTGCLGNWVGGTTDAEPRDGGPAIEPTLPADDPSLPPYAPFAAPMQLLTDTEYANAIEDVLGQAARAALIALPQGRGRGSWIEHNRALTANDAVTEAVERNAFAAAAAALTADPPPAALACLAGARASLVEANVAACAADVAQQMARKLLRRDLTAEEVTRLSSLDATLRTIERDEENTTAPSITEVDRRIEGATAMILQLPEFLYVNERGLPRTDVVAWCNLSSREMATRTSLFLTMSLPDAELLAAADAGELEDPARLDAQIDRLLASPRTIESVKLFAEDLFETWGISNAQLIGLPAGVTAATLAESAAEEIRQIVATIALSATQSDLRNIFTTDLFLDDANLSSVYGFTPAAPTGQPVSRPGAGRGGLLGRAAFLVGQFGTTRPSIIKRGKYIREAILCSKLVNTPLPTVFADNQALAATLPPNHTERDVSGLRLSSASCQGCHNQMDPLAYPFDKFDANGAAVPNYNDLVTLDKAGRIPEAGAADSGQAIAGADAFGQWIAQSDEIGACLTQHWLSQGVGQSVDVGQFVVRKRLAEAFALAGYDVRGLMRAMVKDAAFRTVVSAQ